MALRVVAILFADYFQGSFHRIYTAITFASCIASRTLRNFDLEHRSTISPRDSSNTVRNFISFRRLFAETGKISSDGYPVDPASLAILGISLDSDLPISSRYNVLSFDYDFQEFHRNMVGKSPRSILFHH